MSEPWPEDRLAAISDLSRLAAALSFPGCTTHVDADATPPRLIICHPQVPEAQHITACGDFFCWDRPTGRTPFGFRRVPIDQSAAATAVLLAYLIAKPSSRPEPRG